MPVSFVDSNVLLYLTSGDAAKANRAESVVAAGGAISVQVLNEVANVARRKMHMQWAEVRAMLALLRGLLDVHPLTVETHDAALAIAERYGLSTYDAMIVASALLCGCDTLWSEDMQNGLIIEGRLRIVDPFVAAG
ncbi:PIN domain-containing protein [Prosthecomicrobium pneumaticum]|uniref:Putative nucleic acid-binding protein n=1 Tax=Prosthecomicrobium pneumaticum TaxID=81895 RepID=A0A7W9CVV2_9HYPH|nr:PIN domain-containing protein [Prosthecomicrobium pneumaticum]MBB5752481.1 putative nucleic acid-binding protein [Prosthecomicrobium pneumaticum]